MISLIIIMTLITLITLITSKMAYYLSMLLDLLLFLLANNLYDLRKPGILKKRGVTYRTD